MKDATLAQGNQVLEQGAAEQFKHDLERKVSELEAAGRKREAAEILAEELQRLLACDNLSHEIPHSESLELVLRVVVGSVRNARNNGSYLASTLNRVIRQLPSELVEDMPDFLQHFDHFACSDGR